MSREKNQMRPVRITPHYQKAPAGSCLIEVGGTRVLCSATVEQSVPPFLKGTGKGWVTAEYNMLPGSSSQRIRRERSHVGGRTQEIQRLIGRSLRSCVNMDKLGEHSILIDCDVIDADGGTRTASITGGFVALSLAITSTPALAPLSEELIQFSVAAVSVGIVGGECYLDLDYALDKDADVDMNVVKTSQGKYIEVQGTAENQAFDDEQLGELLSLSDMGIRQLFEAQSQALQS